MAWFDRMFSPEMQYGASEQYQQEPNDGMGGFKYGPFYQLWMQRQQQAQQPAPWQGKNPGHIPTPWVGGPDQRVPTPWTGQPDPIQQVPTPWTGSPQPPGMDKPPMQFQPMSQRRPPVRGVIKR